MTRSSTTAEVATRLLGESTDPYQFDKSHTGDTLSVFQPVTQPEVLKLLSTMPSKSSPMDYISTSVLKKCSHLFAPLLAHLANLCFSEGCFPRPYRHAQVTPLLKRAGLDPTDPAHYRPISNLNTISKVIERLALSRLQRSPNHQTSTHSSPPTDLSIPQKLHTERYLLYDGPRT